MSDTLPPVKSCSCALPWPKVGCPICGGSGTVPDVDDEDDLCEQLGHDDETIFEDETGYDWRCNRCGAEGWEEYD